MPNKAFNNFKIDIWYKAFVYMGAIIVFIGILYPVRIFDNTIIALFGFGLFLFGLGVWKQPPGGCLLINNQDFTHRDLITRIKEIKSKFSFIGLLLIILGGILIIYSTWKALEYYIA